MSRGSTAANKAAKLVGFAESVGKPPEVWGRSSWNTWLIGHIRPGGLLHSFSARQQIYKALILDVNLIRNMLAAVMTSDKFAVSLFP